MWGNNISSRRQYICFRGKICATSTGIECRQRQYTVLQARRQEFPEGGSSTRIASRAPRGRGSGSPEWPPETQRYLEQNSSIKQFQGTSFKLSEIPVFQNSNFTLIRTLISHKMSTLKGVISFQGGVCSNPPNPPPPPGYGYVLYVMGPQYMSSQPLVGF